MRLENNFDNFISYDNVAMEAELKCDCGNKLFTISHTGSQKKGLFGGIIVRKKDNQLVIKAKCMSCSHEYVVYDSTTDGVKPKGVASKEYNDLVVKDNKSFNIKLCYNFDERNFKTDRFEEIFIEVKSKEDSKYKRLVEAW